MDAQSSGMVTRGALLDTTGAVAGISAGGDAVDEQLDNPPLLRAAVAAAAAAAKEVGGDEDEDEGNESKRFTAAAAAVPSEAI